MNIDSALVKLEVLKVSKIDAKRRETLTKLISTLKEAAAKLPNLDMVSQIDEADLVLVLVGLPKLLVKQGIHSSSYKAWDWAPPIDFESKREKDISEKPAFDPYE